MKSMRLLLVWLIAACLSGCQFYPFAPAASPGAKEESAAGRTVIRVWGGTSPEEGFRQVIEQFNAQYRDRGIRAVYEQYASGDRTANLKLETSLLSGGNDIDVYLSYTTQALSKRVSANIALDLSALIERDGFDMEKNFSGDVKKLYFDDKPYSVPSTIGKMGIIVNKDLFDAAGIAVPTEWTYEEFRNIAKRLTSGAEEDKVYGVFWNTQANISEALLHLVLPTLGGDPLYRNGGRESNLDDPVIAQALELLRTTMLEDLSAPTHVESVTRKLSMDGVFTGGKAAMTVGAWMYGSLLGETGHPHRFVAAFAPWPVVEKGRRQYTQGSFGGHLSINPNSPHIDAAWEFVKWYSTSGCKLLIPYGFTPSYTGFSQEEVASELIRYADGKADADSAIALFLNPDSNLSIPLISRRINELTTVFDDAVEAVLTEKRTTEQALSEAKKKGDRLLRESRK